MSTISWATNPKTTPTNDTDTAGSGNQGGGDPEDSCTNGAGTDFNTDTGRDDATNAGQGPDDGPMPGQTSLWALIQALRPDRQPPGRPAWPPEQGPVPDWAQPAPNTDDSSGNDGVSDNGTGNGYITPGGHGGASAIDHDSNDSNDSRDSQNAGDSCATHGLSDHDDGAGRASDDTGVSDNENDDTGVTDHDNNRASDDDSSGVSATDDGAGDSGGGGVGRVGIFPPGESAPLDTDPACPPDQWPRMVDGVSVPAPGQDRTLPGWTSSTRKASMRRSLTGAPAPSNCSTGSWTACAWPPPPAPCRPPAG